MPSWNGFGFNENETQVVEPKFLYLKTKTETIETLRSTLEGANFLLEHQNSP